ncbi:MAG: DUF1214 domain-containing protein [Candidatus Binatia bacterium]|nr:DUF1214 domain-containing protein [Candidatus Binatia bacterium]
MSDDATRRLVDGTAWDEFCDRLKSAGHEVLDAASEDPFERAEGLRYLTRLTRNFLKAAVEESDPAAPVLSTENPKIGLDNPDYVYARARISSRYEYRLRGHTGDTQMISFGAFSGALGTPQGLIRDGYVTTDELDIADDGSFEIVLSSEEHASNWLPVGPDTNALQIRQTLLARHRQRPSPMELVRVDGGAPPPPLDPVAFSRALDRVGVAVAGTVGVFLGWTESFRAHLHQIRPIDPKLLAFAQGDPNTSYNYGYWELGPGDAFVIEFTPPSCEYWNLQIGNHWLESLDFRHHRTHVNHETAVAGPDGSVRVVVAHRDPGVPNWLDTAGHTRGGLALRFVGAREIPEPRTEVVPVGRLA